MNKLQHTTERANGLTLNIKVLVPITIITGTRTIKATNED